MSRIQSSIGLITGIPIEETVNKLMAVAARPRDLIVDRTKVINEERLAITNLTSLMLAFEFEVNKLSTPKLFEAKSVTSSDSDVLSAKLLDGANPAVGQYRIRPLQTASAHQLASGSLQNLDDLPSEGSLSFGFGGHVDKGIALSELNGGAGVRRGQIRITDRGGNVADIDLRVARTIDDVLNAINTNETANVRAVAVGDSLKLIDSSGGSGNLRVQELGGGQTALDLGLAGINVAANEATGADVLSLHSGTKLSLLNDGNGVPLAAGADLQITLADSTSLSVDLGAATTLGEVISALNDADPAKFSASIAADGRRIELTDLTTGASTFAVTDVGNGTAADALGLTAAAAGNSITGNRLISGLRDTLIGSLRGGAGLGTLGSFDITNRNNATSNVDLSTAETLGQIVDAINAQAVGVSAAVNTAHNGITLSDTTGGTASNLIVADADANNTATALGVVVDEATTSVNSGSLGRQQISRATLLSSLNGGKGIDIADMFIVDSKGVTGAVDLNTPGNEATTIGDVIDRINAITTADVEARINDTGDGILLIDNANGDGKLEVKEVGNNTAAADLRLLGTGLATDVEGTTKQVIDGTSRFTVDFDDLAVGGAAIALSSLNSGGGVPNGAFKITDSSGNTAAIVVNSTFETVADVIDAINATNINVEARLNDAGTGILLYETVEGSGTLKVEELAGGATAAALGLTREAKDKVIDGDTRQSIDGAGTIPASAAQSGLASLATRINSLERGVVASTVFDGFGYRLMLTAEETGAANALLVDGLEAGLSFEELSRPQDAVIEFGGSSTGSGLIVASADNTFDDIIPGVELTVHEASDENVIVEVEKAQSELVTAVQELVDAFNSVRENLDEVTEFNAEDQTTGILFGTTAALRVESDLNRLLSGRFLGVGRFASLESIGLSFDDKGKLELNTDELEDALAQDPAALEQFFTHSTLGLAAKLKTAIKQLAGEDNSVLASRAESLTDIIENNSDRITLMDARLARQREQLLTQFFQLESTIAAMQTDLTALAGLQAIPPLTSTSRS